MTNPRERPAVTEVVIDAPLRWRDVAAVADGAGLSLSPAARRRIAAARAVVEALVANGARVYGVTTGVGALSEVVVPREKQRQLSRNLLMSHAVGVGAPLGAAEVRAIVAAQVNGYAHGYSGLRPDIVDLLLRLLAMGCVPEVPGRGSIGYLTHMAHIGLVLVGEGTATVGGARLPGAGALAAIGARPVVLEAKEGLSLINGTPCATGLACVALARTARLLDWADAVAATTFEALRGEPSTFDARPLALRKSPGLATVGKRLRAYLAGSALLAGDRRRTQDALSLRAVPHVHGAARDTFDHVANVVDRELASVTDNPLVAGSPEAPEAFSEAHSVGAALALALDALAVAVASVAAMSERRIDRLVNPLVSGLPAFLAADGGAGSGYMIAQYTALSLVNDNRRLAAPASLDGGITSALQEDYIPHPTPAALKLLAILDNAEEVLGIELVAAADAHTLGSGGNGLAPGTAAVLARVRAVEPPYRDDRPLADHIASGRDILRGGPAPAPPEGVP
jgi:histidine ammonia-lyase